VTAAVIDVHDLTFGWRPDQPLLRIDKLVIPTAERVFVHGPSGSGKSTLLSLLAGVLVPQRGVLRVLGTEVPRLTAVARDAFRADHFGVIFQMFNLVPYLSVGRRGDRAHRGGRRHGDGPAVRGVCSSRGPSSRHIWVSRSRSGRPACTNGSCCWPSCSPASSAACGQPSARTVTLVRTGARPFKIRQSFEQVSVTGRLRTERARNELVSASYVIEATQVERQTQ
jgi:ABC-type Fe3+/spermidine/putrescine transport system ATPase subunit